MSEIDFKSSSKQGYIIEIGIDVVKFGATSITLTCQARNIRTRDIILTIDKITMVSLDEYEKPYPHGKTSLIALFNSKLSQAGSVANRMKQYKP